MPSAPVRASRPVRVQVTASVLVKEAPLSTTPAPLRVSDRLASHSIHPGRPAMVKSITHDPMAKARVTMAAVALLSVIDAANSATAPMSRP